MVFNINYTYYENYDLLDQIIKYYTPFKDDRSFKFTIIDDGSSRQPLSRKNIPKWWTLYRIEQDLGWGNEICRNILMRNTPQNWNVLIDLDYLIDLEDSLCYESLVKLFPKYYRQLYDLKIIFQFDKGRRVKYDDYTQEEPPPGPGSFISINSFIISRSSFLNTHGYDQAFGWTYGYDFTLFTQYDSEIIMPDTKLKKIAEFGTNSHGRFKPGDRRAFSDYHTLRDQYVKEGVYEIGKGWKSESERLKRCVTTPNVIVL